MSGYATNRWRGVLALSLVAGAVGLLADQPAVILLALLGVVFGTYPRLMTVPEPELELERRVSDTAPAAGEEVEVTTTIRNEGSRTLFDLRVVDGVPPALSVTEGSPRHAAVLRPGRSTTFSYWIEVEHGKHGFEPATVVVRDPSGANELRTTVATDAETEIDCSVDLPDGPLHAELLGHAGRLLSNDGGSGIEFHQTREYRPGDGMGRVDWKRYARTGDLTTVEFRRERAATVVILIDARASAYRAADDGPHAVARSVSTAKQLHAAFLGSRNRVGLASLGRELCWLAPGAGSDHAARTRRLLATHANFSSAPPASERSHAEQIDALTARLPNDAQLVVVSPLCDDTIVSTVRSLAARGHPASVISPDPTGSATLGQRLAAVERDRRISTLRASDVLVVDWQATEPLATTLETTARRRSA